MIHFRTKSKVNSIPKEHDYYFELSALASSGTLTDAEWSELRFHLSECAECKERIQKYRELTKTGMSLLMPDANGEDLSAQESWSPELAKQELFARLVRGETAAQHHLHAQIREPKSQHWFGKYLPGLPTRAALAYAAAVVLVVGSIFVAYRIGQGRGHELALPAIQSSTTEAASLRTQLAEVSRELTAVNEQLEARDAEIVSLTRDLQRQHAEVQGLKALISEAEQNAHDQFSEVARLAGERDTSKQKLQEAEATLVATQRRLDTLEGERSAELQQFAMLQNRVENLSARLKESDETVKQQQQLLAYDRDIRELMGARELYIADVFDVDDTGRMRKPYGRIFYTQRKSLIFYAFDLDQQPGVRNAVFQAWGRRGPTDKQPLSLGILYLDNETNRRWALKFDDPKVLAQIDAVFVTVEPRSGSRKPSGKQLLFASLRTPANHP